MDVAPINYKKRDRATIRSDIDYALAQVEAMERAINLAGLKLDGLRILELGPGSNFGPQLMIASKGAKITLADRFLAKWDPDYHPEFYTMLSEHIADHNKEILSVISKGEHSASSLTLLEESAEDLRSIPDGSIDFVYSNAVLEHIRDLERVAAETSRVTRLGGWGYHQIDWRYHVNFNRPLDHLPILDEAFLHEAEISSFEVGNRLRSIEFWANFEKAGLAVRQRGTTMSAEADYFAEILPRIRGGTSSYRDWPQTDLQRISGFFLVHREAGPEATLVRERGADMAALVGSLKTTSEAAGRYAWKDGSIEIELERPHFLEGYLWRQMIPDLPQGDSLEQPGRSELVLLEDGHPLGPSHSSTRDIAALGRGRYSHWMNELHFSASDNSSPVDNGRKYSIRIPKHQN